MKNTRFALLGVACLLLAPLGCAQRTTTNVTITNSSTSDLRVNAWMAGEVDPAQMDDQRAESAREIKSGSNTTFALYRPEAPKDTPVVVRLAPIGADENNPYWIQLEPPGPYVLRVRGTGSDLVMTRENVDFDENASGPGGIPPSPQERRYRGTLPPWVAR